MTIFKIGMIQTTKNQARMYKKSWLGMSLSRTTVMTRISTGLALTLPADLGV